MKRIFLPILAIVAAFSLHAQTPVTLKVDMKNTTVNGVVNVAGDIQEAAGFGPNWTPTATGNELSDADGDGIWEITFSVPPGVYNYKFVNGDDGWENVPSACANSGNRRLIVDAVPVTRQFCFEKCENECTVEVNVDVTFQVNMVGLAVSTDGMIMAGSFGSSGYPNWNGSADGIKMEDPDGDGIWTKTLTLKNGTYNYKFLNGVNGWENVPCACSVAGNREFVVPPSAAPVTVPPVFIKDCDNTFNGNIAAAVTFRVDMSSESLGPGGLFLAGSLQAQPWTKNVDKLSDANGDDIYEITLDVAPGEHEYKFYNGDYTQGSPTGGDDQFAEGQGYNFNDNGCGCLGGGFNNRLLNVVSGPPVTLPVYVYNSCQVTSATHDLSTAANIRIYPNPASRNAYLEFEGAQSGEHSVLIVNQFGQTVRTYESFAGQQLQIQKGNLVPGLYFVTLRNAKGESATLKLNIQ